MNKVRAIVWFLGGLLVFLFVWGLAEMLFPEAGDLIFKMVGYAAIFVLAAWLAGKMFEYGTKIWKGETRQAEVAREVEFLRQQAERKQSEAEDLRAKAAELLRSA